MKLAIVNDYPYDFLSEHHWNGASIVEMDDEEYNDYKTVVNAFEEWQLKIKKLDKEVRDKALLASIPKREDKDFVF